jgi:chromosome partitioning protein
MPKLISFVQQKGGTGKTTMTMLTAGYFHDNGANIIVVDTDYPQLSFVRIRHRDLHNLSEEDAQKRTGEEILQEQGKKLYPVISSNVNESATQLGVIKTSAEFQFVFCDLPGTLNVSGIQKVFKLLDYIIIPCELEDKSIIAALETMDVIRGFNPDIPIGFVWTKIKRKHRVAERLEYEAYIKSMHPVHIFQYILYDTVRVSQQLNTLTSQPDTILDFVSELTGLIKGNLVHH